MYAEARHQPHSLTMPPCSSDFGQAMAKETKLCLRLVEGTRVCRTVAGLINHRDPEVRAEPGTKYISGYTHLPK